MKRLLRFIPAFGWMGVIFYLSHQTGEELGDIFPFVTNFNWGHLVAYFILTLLLGFAFWPINSLKKGIYVFVISVLYGISDEFHQSFIPTRTPEINDLITDTIGTLVGLVILYGLQALMNKGLTKELPVNKNRKI